MKKIDNFATWIFADDVTAGTTEIRTEEARSLDQQKVNRTISDVGEIVLILAAVMMIGLPVVAILWPH